MKTETRGGFTLIEMLVVVAVIGILSSVLLTALGPARDKAKDSRITQEVNQVRSIAETLYNGRYTSLPELPAEEIINSDLKALSDDIAVQGGALVIIKSYDSKIYSAYSRMNTKVGVEPDLQTQYYCTDSSGRSGFTTEEPSEPRCPF